MQIRPLMLFTRILWITPLDDVQYTKQTWAEINLDSSKNTFPNQAWIASYTNLGTDGHLVQATMGFNIRPALPHNRRGHLNLSLHFKARPTKAERTNKKDPFLFCFHAHAIKPCLESWSSGA